MKRFRLYTGDDGKSHFENLDDHGDVVFFDTVQPVKGLVFRKAERSHILDWHRAVRRQWVITLSGSVDIGIGDGSVVSFGPGDVFLAEDTTGQGHTANPKQWIRAFVQLE
jgi:hypothetical protein